jgi:hypothetical protein
MQSRMLLAIGVFFATGCTASQLRYNTVGQFQTLTDLQHQVVLNNLAAFACNPDAIPAQANLTAGTTQVVDYSSANSQLANSAFNSLVVTLGLSRSHVDQWSSTPVTDEMTLRLLRVAYRRGLGSEEDLYRNDLANRLAHRFKAQLLSSGDMGIANSLMHARGPAIPQLLDRAGWNGDDQLGFKSTDPAVEIWRKDVRDVISLSSARIIQEGEYLQEGELSVTPALVDGKPHIVDGETLPRVKVATPYAAEIRRQVYELNKYLMEIQSGWVCIGSKCDVPKCACYIGHHETCDCECYVWVLPEHQALLDDFTLRILRLATLMQPQTQTNQGIMFSPIQTR